MLVKDISRLNRDLSRVIVMDTDPSVIPPEQRDNCVFLKPWEGDFNDTELPAYLLFLENLGLSAGVDVRKVIKSYEGTHIPTVFNERLVKMKNEIQRQRQEVKKKSILGGGW